MYEIFSLLPSESQQIADFIYVYNQSIALRCAFVSFVSTYIISRCETKRIHWKKSNIYPIRLECLIPTNHHIFNPRIMSCSVNSLRKPFIKCFVRVEKVQRFSRDYLSLSACHCQWAPATTDGMNNFVESLSIQEACYDKQWIPISTRRTGKKPHFIPLDLTFTRNHCLSSNPTLILFFHLEKCFRPWKITGIGMYIFRIWLTKFNTTNPSFLGGIIKIQDRPQRIKVGSNSTLD